jgi:hypothetical protein
MNVATTLPANLSGLASTMARERRDEARQTIETAADLIVGEMHKGEYGEDLWAEIARMLADRSPAAFDAVEDMTLIEIMKVAAKKRAEHDLRHSAGSGS